MHRNDFASALDAFGLRLIGDPEPLEGGTDNDNCRVATDRGAMVVREYRISGPDRIRAELRLVAFLAAQGFPTPVPLPAGGDLILEADHPIAVFPWMPGETPTELTAPLAEQVGGLLARMHLLTADWDDEVPVIDRLDLLTRAIESPCPLAGADAWREHLCRFLADRADELERLGRLPSGPLHHDLHRQNLLVADGEVTAVLDFDELNRGPLVLDVARVLQYAALDRPDRRLPQETADAVLSGYERTRALSGAEHGLLQTALDLAGLVDAAMFIRFDAADMGVTDVDECHSWTGYLRNTDALA